MFSKNKLSIPLFVAGSIASLILVAAFLIAFKAKFYVPDNQLATTTPDRQGALEPDPFITAAPGAAKVSKPLLNGTDPVLGDQAAPLALVEYSDFTCSYCHEQEQNIKRALDEFGNRVKLVWKDYPDKNPNSISFKAALAGRCAAAQGQFWPYHDKLAPKASGLSEDKLFSAAAELGLDTGEFKKCYNRENFRSDVENNILEADALKITGTPLLFVGNLQFMGQLAFEDLKKAIEFELSQN